MLSLAFLLCKARTLLKLGDMSEIMSENRQELGRMPFFPLVSI